MSTPQDRRTFLTTSSLALGALVVGIPASLRAGRDARRAGATETPDAAAGFAPNEYVRIDTTGAVTIVVARSEMGQGVRTALPMILADELGADWARITIEQAIPSTVFADLSTGGSMSVGSQWLPLRTAGAAARDMLIAVAATRLGVPADTLHTAASEVRHRESGKAIAFGELVTAAAALPVPTNPALKDNDAFQFIGKPVKRVDGSAIVRGTATYGLDVRVPGMRFAVMAMPPVPGGIAASFNAAAARAVSGVRDVITLPTGIAVVADSTWAAIKGRRALAVQWTHGANVRFTSAAHRAELRATVRKPGAITARSVGDAPAVLDAAPTAAVKRVSATYEFPFQAHATMEPQNCTAWVRDGACELWVGTQEPNGVQRQIAEALALPLAKITVHVPLLGGGFGRRITNEYATDAALLSQRVNAPVQLVWTREDDFAHDWYQPMSVSRCEAVLGANRLPAAWRQRVAAAAVTASFGPQVAMEAEMLGARDMPYAIPNVRAEYSHVPVPMKTGWWRAIQFVPNVFARESFVDELARAAGVDPLEYRLQMLTEESLADMHAASTTGPRFAVDRLRAVLQMAGTMSGWHVPLPKGRGRGIACLSYDDRSYVAQVAEVEIVGGALKVTKLFTAIDVGQMINPLGLVGQVESGIAWALTAVLHGEMPFTGGRAARTSFGEYRVTSLTEMPVMETYVMPAHFPPSGAGEPPVPAVAPAIANAVFAATGRRIRSLPILRTALVGA